ncbi:hypothetical protein Apa02nite_024200 [Actinoplanes palleronii]|uniref:Transposase n=1 Tax=Actinoplanes palleronii TaxID=113570 RepID=A0ABQ4B6U7_9ACTN|nr:hypothetical protein Apa02nite_024200 [Actinoplanes palleronii]
MVRSRTKIELVPGSVIVLERREWAVTKVEPQYGRVCLEASNGELKQTSVRELLHDADCRQSSRSSFLPADRGRQPATWDDLTKQQQEWAALRIAHVNELVTGFRSGSPRSVP